MVYFVLYMEKVQTGIVIEFYSNTCLVKVEEELIPCIAIKDVVVGDVVEIKKISDSKEKKAKIVARKKRFSLLARNAKQKNKAIAANISHIGILVTNEPKTSYEFIDKWLLSSNLSGIVPFIIENKMDLNSSNEFKEKIKLYSDLGIEVISISAKKRLNLNKLITYLNNKSIILVGNSGAGKSTLTSALTNKNIKTSALSNNQGVHTTSISTMYEINKGTHIIDSPGVRDLPISGWEKQDIIKGFPEIYELSKDCKFRNCKHLKDKGCAVIESLKMHNINTTRYNNFIKFRDEELSEG